MHIVPLRRAGEASLVVAAVAVDLSLWDGDRALVTGGQLPWAVIPVLTVAAHLTLPMRWRHPRTVLAVQCCLALGNAAVPAFSPFVGLLVALYAVGRRCSPRSAAAALGASCAILALHSYHVAVRGSGEDLLGDVLVAAGLWCALSSTVWGFGRLALGAQQRSEEAQRQHAEQLLREERLRVARELHDTIAHGVSVMLLQAAGARAIAGGHDDRVDHALHTVETMGVQTMDELHRLLGLLRASGDACGARPHGHQPCVGDVPDLVALVRDSGLDVTLVVEGEPAPLDQSVDLAGYRVVQEALTNVVKHARDGASSHVHLRWAEDLRITVADDGAARASGRRRPELSSGFGLVGLAERVALVGGSLETARTSEGFTVRAVLPLRQRATGMTGPVRATVPASTRSSALSELG